MTALKFTQDHEWIRVEGDTGTVGITEFAQEELGDLVYVELPEIGKHFAQGNEAAVIESVKAAADLKAPVSGTITQVNSSLTEEPGKVNADPMGAGWFFKITLANAGELDALLDVAAYEALVRK
jgi:glycine cleavage system H protein